jgi:hypothetical protein
MAPLVQVTGKLTLGIEAAAQYIVQSRNVSPTS